MHSRELEKGPKTRETEYELPALRSFHPIILLTYHWLKVRSSGRRGGTYGGPSAISTHAFHILTLLPHHFLPGDTLEVILNNVVQLYGVRS